MRRLRTYNEAARDVQRGGYGCTTRWLRMYSMAVRDV